MTKRRKPKVTVWKFASCDGCQLSLLNCEDELLTVAGEIQIAYFLEASRATLAGPYDISLVEGSITTPEDLTQIRQIRQVSKTLIALGACATAGGIQALRNFASTRDYAAAVYPMPDAIRVLENSTPIADHVYVDFELRGCPIHKLQLVEVLSAFLHGRKPNIPTYSVCVECKRRGTPCVMVALGLPCMGPITQAGCGAICPAYGRGCYGCFGPMETPNPAALADRWQSALGLDDCQVVHLLRSFNAAAEPFRREAEKHESS